MKPLARPAPEGPARQTALGTVLVRNVLANVLGRGLSIVAWLAITPFVLASLGPERFGFWSLLSTVAVTALLLDLGLGSAVTKYVAEYGDESQAEARKGAFTTSALVACGLAVLWTVGGYLARDLLVTFAHVAPGWHDEARDAAGILALAAGTGLLALVPGAALTGVHRLDLVNRITVVATLVQVTASVLLLLQGAGLRGLMLALLLGSATSLVASVLVLRRVAPGLALDLRAAARAPVRQQLGFSAALQAISLGVLLQFQLPKFVLARWVSLSAVGEFELGYRVAFAAWSLPTLVLPPLLPALSEMAAQGRWDRAWELYRRAARYLLVVALPIAAMLAAMSRPLFLAWLGPGHERAALALTSIASLLGINVLTSTGCLLGRAIGRPWMEAGYHLASLVLHVGLALLLVPALGWRGALLAMLVSGTFGTAQFLWVFHRALGRSLRGFLAGIAATPALASLVGGALAWVIATVVGAGAADAGRARALLGLVAGGACGVAAISLTLIRMRYLGREEMAGILERLPRAMGRP